MSRRQVKVQRIIDKITTFKDSNNIQGQVLDFNGELVQRFLSRLTDEELQLIGVIANKSKGELKGFKRVFKQYGNLMQGLNMTAYSAVHQNRALLELPNEPIDLIGDDVLRVRPFKNETENIVEFYEIILKQNNFSDESGKLLRAELEEELSRMFYIENGIRVYN